MLREQPFLFGDGTWLHVWDGNPTAAALYDRHYSRNPASRGDPRRVRSANPGYCFMAAGWRRCGITKTRRLIVLEALPSNATGTAANQTEGK